MNNQWVTPGGDPIDSDWAPPSNPMPPSNDWNDASGCNASSGPAIVDGITITGVPAHHRCALRLGNHPQRWRGAAQFLHRSL